MIGMIILGLLSTSYDLARTRNFQGFRMYVSLIHMYDGSSTIYNPMGFDVEAGAIS